jgi:hypothetical protein
MNPERKRRLVTFGDIANVTTPAKPAAPGGTEPGRIERATYADLAKLSKRPEDFLQGIPQTGPRDEGVPEAGPGQFASGRTIRVARSARDGHSLGEQAVYEALWTNAQPYTENCRTLAVGYRSLSRLCGLTVNNCKANLQGLARKLAIAEAGGHSYTQAKSYLVYGEAEILRRRRAAGLTHYLKSRGVVFVDAATGAEKGIPESGTPSNRPSAP